LFPKETISKSEIWTGKVYRTCTELDMLELVQINRVLDRNVKLGNINPETILSQFGGHTIFSLYSDELEVYK